MTIKLAHADSQLHAISNENLATPIHNQDVFSASLQNNKFVYTTNSEPKTDKGIHFVPNLIDNARLIIPISYARYDGNIEKRMAYDRDISTLLSYTAHLLSEKKIESVDVLATGGLQAINWGIEKTHEIESHFLTTHQLLLSLQTKVYTWDDWIEEKGVEIFQKSYMRVVSDSSCSTEWYNLMVKTHEKSSTSNDLLKSLEYQRKEYAAILLMTNYTNLAYLGHISQAWSFLYHKYHNEGAPIFTRVASNVGTLKEKIKKSDASHTVRMMLSNLEDTLASENFPNSEKEILIENAISLFYTYRPKST